MEHIHLYSHPPCLFRILIKKPSFLRIKLELARYRAKER